MGINQEFQENADDGILCHQPRFETVEFNKTIWAEKSISETAGPLAYAFNLPQLGDAKPGKMGMRPSMDDGKFYPTLYPRTREELRHRLNYDGILYVGNVLPENDEEHVVAFFAREADHPIHTEMVILRRDYNGLWSTKTTGDCGSGAIPSQMDFSDKPIVDPLKANFGPFTNFLGFAIVPDEGFTYYARITLSKKAIESFSLTIQNSPTFGTP